MPGIVGAFVGREEVERRRDQGADLIEAARPRRSQERFELAERELDRIEVRTVGRKKPQVRPGLLKGHPDVGVLVHREIVEHDDIAGLERRDQDLFDVGEKTRTIDRPIKHGWRPESLEAERRDHRMRLPVAAGGVIGEPRAARAPAVATQQIGRDAAFIEKDVPPPVAERQPLTPAAPRSRDVRATLFVGVDRFF
jgi:hypothetical protein